MLGLCVLLSRGGSCGRCLVFVRLHAMLHDRRLHERAYNCPEGWGLARIAERIFSFGRWRLALLAEVNILGLVLQIGLLSLLLILLVHSKALI
jgi:hypothetical protein